VVRACWRVGVGEPISGEGVGGIDCHVGGPEGTCGSLAARVDYSATSEGEYQFSACVYPGDDDTIVTLNGHQLTQDMGGFPLTDGAVIGIGARVFIFLLPKYPSIVHA